MVGGVVGAAMGGWQGGWTGFVSGALSGATFGVVLGATGNPYMAGAAAGAVGSITNQILNGRNPFSPTSMGQTTIAIGVGMLSGGLASRLAPWLGERGTEILVGAFEGTTANAGQIVISGAQAAVHAGERLIKKWTGDIEQNLP